MIDPYEGMAEPDASALRDPHLCGEDEWLGVDTLPVPEAVVAGGR
jgi:hypothetical protein